MFNHDEIRIEIDDAFSKYLTNLEASASSGEREYIALLIKEVERKHKLAIQAANIIRCFLEGE